MHFLFAFLVWVKQRGVVTVLLEASQIAIRLLEPAQAEASTAQAMCVSGAPVENRLESFS